MTYATLADLTDRFGLDMLVQVSDRTNAGVVDQGAIDRALADTDARINASLVVRYRLPLDQVPDVILDLALTIAIYKLHRYAPDPKIADDYKQALKDLGDLANGVTKLDVAGIEPPSSGSGGVVVTDRDRPLSADQMTGFI